MDGLNFCTSFVYQSFFNLVQSLFHFGSSILNNPMFAKDSIYILALKIQFWNLKDYVTKVSTTQHGQIKSPSFQFEVTTSKTNTFLKLRSTNSCLKCTIIYENPVLVLKSPICNTLKIYSIFIKCLKIYIYILKESRIPLSTTNMLK